MNEKIQEMEEMIKDFKSNITEVNIPIQYPINEFDFSNCKDKEEIMKYAEIYSKELHKMMNENLMSPNVLEECKKQKDVTQLGMETLNEQKETYIKRQVETEMEKQQNEIIFPPKEDEPTKE